MNIGHSSHPDIFTDEHMRTRLHMHTRPLTQPQKRMRIQMRVQVPMHTMMHVPMQIKTAHGVHAHAPEHDIHTSVLRIRKRKKKTLVFLE